MKRFVQLKPTAMQGFINENKTDLDRDTAKDVKEITLGLNDESVWGKRFKVRFTSKSSGKRFDINVGFVHD